MNTQEVLDPKSWAERTLGGDQLHDRPRTRRAVQAESRAGGEPLGVAACPNAGLERDQSLVSFARTEPDVTFAALMQPHFQQAREQATSSPVILLVQDTR
jgi:hypothetical protein